jgi:uncharacterized protein (DUF1697 family)
MQTFIALLRGINVGGHNKIAMADFHDLCGRLGFENPRTLLQSGNVVLRSASRSASQLERQLETETEKSFGLQIHFFVRTIEEWREIIAANPFPKEAIQDPSHLVVMCFKKSIDSKALDDLRTAIIGPELIKAKGRHAYITYPAGIGTSRLTNVLIEKKLASPGTARNWNTVLKLAAVANA